jgi:hypothetical protein
MTDRTELNIASSKWRIRHDDNCLSIGSCFADNIGHKMNYYGLNCDVNTFGTTYNPLSIVHILDLIMQKKEVNPARYICHNSVHYHYDFHSRMSALTKEALAYHIEDSLAKLKSKLDTASYLFVTVGTTIGYKLRENREWVNNCHKQPQDLFVKEDISVTEGTEALVQCVNSLHLLYPQLKIVFTLSPVRHIKDGIIHNSLSKARCLLMIHECINQLPSICQYLPAYEWVMDDLRDYRYYADDLIHPNNQAIKYIWDKMSAHFFDEETLILCKDIAQIRSGLSHRPFHPETSENQEFLKKIRSKADAISERLPHILWT